MDISDEVSRGRIGSKYWVNSEHDSFSEITRANFQLPSHWAHSRFIQDTPFADKIIKPLNGYSMIFWPMPEISFVENKAVLRYKTHAEIWLEKMDRGLYALDKTWQRQFYPSDINQDAPEECFNAIYKFYIPWIINKDIECKIYEVDGSPFKIINDTVKFNKLDDSLIWDVDWFHFAIKNHGDHIEEYRSDTYGIIERGSDICYLVIDDEDVINELRKQYDK
jgi:hypothetical protein